MPKSHVGAILSQISEILSNRLIVLTICLRGAVWSLPVSA
jgi:hypothetical protein